MIKIEKTPNIRDNLIITQNEKKSKNTFAFTFYAILALVAQPDILLLKNCFR